ncbi:serine hydrolase domain-containing protein [Paenibacillaceae bacterium WGS1546]|uniref:serine hydrolase domain-containing protein n=1 Tax=Cohnella sp. WGS1546 TaxID=3366810 RepID=UPI00372D41A8
MTGCWELPTDPAEAGFDGNRLGRIRERLGERIREGKLAGAAACVSKKGRVALCEIQGYADVESGKALLANSIFRLASMTKPIVAVAVMKLAEQGGLALEDPLSRFIPAFGAPQVAVPHGESSVSPYAPNPDSPAGHIAEQAVAYALTPAVREATIRDLLTHSSGLGQGPIGFRQITLPPPGATLADHVPSWVGAPLDFQPGTRTGYSPVAAFDLLGRIVEIVSDMPLDRYLRQMLFEPLGMKDTTFAPSKEQWERVVTMYQSTERGLSRSADQKPFFHPTYFSGAAGLFSTLEDYVRFARMLANGGEFEGRRILNPHTVQAMASPQLPESIEGFPSGQTWGLGMRVVTRDHAANTSLTKGSFGWSGAWGTHFWIDPKHEIVAALMINLANAGGADAETAREFESDVMAALPDR